MPTRMLPACQFRLSPSCDSWRSHLDEAAWMRRGIANQGEITVRAVAYTIAGHELHHRQIWIEKYLG